MITSVTGLRLRLDNYLNLRWPLSQGIIEEEQSKLIFSPFYTSILTAHGRWTQSLKRRASNKSACSRGRPQNLRVRLCPPSLAHNQNLNKIMAESDCEDTDGQFDK